MLLKAMTFCAELRLVAGRYKMISVYRIKNLPTSQDVL